MHIILFYKSDSLYIVSTLSRISSILYQSRTKWQKDSLVYKPDMHYLLPGKTLIVIQTHSSRFSHLNILRLVIAFRFLNNTVLCRLQRCCRSWCSSCCCGCCRSSSNSSCCRNCCCFGCHFNNWFWYLCDFIWFNSLLRHGCDRAKLILIFLKF